MWATAIGRLVELVRAAMRLAEDHQRVPALLAVGHRLLHEPLEIRQRVGVAGLQRQGFQGAAQRLCFPAQRGKGQPQVVAGGRVGGVLRQRLRD